MRRIANLTALMAGTALALCLAPRAALAQDADQAGDADAAIVVTASRSGEGVAQDRLGASVTVIDAEALDQRQTRAVSDVLRDVPGVAVGRTGAAGGQTQVRIRGTEGNHVLVLVDGIEVADPYSGEFDFGGLLADPAARIEVLRGQQSSLYGSDAIGGVIHYITLSGREAPGVSARAEAGSFDTFGAAARVAGASDRLDYALSGTWYRTGGYPTARGGVRDVGADGVGASAKVTLIPSDALTLTGVVRYSWTDADQNNSETDPASPLFGYTVDSPGVRFTNEAVYALASAELSALEGRWTNTLSGQVARTERKGYAPPAAPDTDPFDSGDIGKRAKGSFVSSVRLGGEAVSHRITAALDLERESFRNTAPATGSPFDPFTGSRHADNLGIVGQYEVLAGDFSGGASIRYDDNDRFDDATTWRVQGSYRLPAGTRLHAAYGTGVKNPGFFELYGYYDGDYIGNPDLRPEKSEGWEAGVEQGLAGGEVTLGATYFNSVLKGEIYTVYPAPDFIATSANRTTRSKQRGVEFYLSARPAPRLRIDANYTVLDAKEDGAEEVRRPGDSASFNATYAGPDERYSATLTVRYNGEMTDVAFTDPSYVPVIETLDGFVLVNLAARYRLGKGVELFGRVENLLDTHYEEVFSYVSPGRGVYGGVRARF